MWSGSIDAVPGGWQLCDGTNGTPDLRNRFIVGAGSGYSIGNTGGSQSVTLTTAQIPSHTHTGSVNSDGSHTHTFALEKVAAAGTGSASAGGVHTSYNVIHETDEAGAHTHTLTINSTGSGSSHENRPPYYALAYIMKMY